MNQNIQNVKLLNFRCFKCANYKPIYIHPWSEGVSEELKGTCNGFACILPLNEKFMESFDGNLDGLRVDVTIGKIDSIGCENFTEHKK